MSEEVAVREASELAVRNEMSLDELVGQVTLIQDAMKVVMQDGVHYGVIPGTEKPTLYKPGAEKLCLLFRLSPTYETHEAYDDQHYTVRATCILTHIPTGVVMGSGEGLATTKEKKYGTRQAKRVCPACGAATIIKGKAEYGGGWICWKKQGGCGAAFPDGDQVIETQETGDVINPDIADTYNTVLKMACKRALTAGVLNVTAASDIFTQDMEDIANPAKPKPRLVTIEETAQLINVLDGNDDAPDLWGPEVVLANASRRFGRQINSYSELRLDEAVQIMDGAADWRRKHPLEPVDGDIEFAPDMPYVEGD